MPADMLQQSTTEKQYIQKMEIKQISYQIRNLDGNINGKRIKKSNKYYDHWSSCTKSVRIKNRLKNEHRRSQKKKRNKEKVTMSVKRSGSVMVVDTESKQRSVKKNRQMVR